MQGESPMKGQLPEPGWTSTGRLEMLPETEAELWRIASWATARREASTVPCSERIIRLFANGAASRAPCFPHFSNRLDSAPP